MSFDLVAEYQEQENQEDQNNSIKKELNDSDNLNNGPEKPTSDTENDNKKQDKDKNIDPTPKNPTEEKNDITLDGFEEIIPVNEKILSMFSIIMKAFYLNFFRKFQSLSLKANSVSKNLNQDKRPDNGKDNHIISNSGVLSNLTRKFQCLSLSDNSVYKNLNQSYEISPSEKNKTYYLKKREREKCPKKQNHKTEKQIKNNVEYDINHPKSISIDETESIGNFDIALGDYNIPCDSCNEDERIESIQEIKDVQFNKKEKGKEKENNC